MKGTMTGIFKAKPEPGAEWRTDLPIPDVGGKGCPGSGESCSYCRTDLHILPWTEYAQKRYRTNGVRT